MDKLSIHPTWVQHLYHYWRQHGADAEWERTGAYLVDKEFKNEVNYDGNAYAVWICTNTRGDIFYGELETPTDWHAFDGGMEVGE